MRTKWLPRQISLLGIGLLFATWANGGLLVKATAGDNPPSAIDTPRPSLECYADRTLHAPAPFHLSWKRDDASGHTDWEADVTADTIDGTLARNAVVRKIHGERRDLSSWQGAFAAFPFGSETGHFRLIANNSGMTVTGQERFNDYATTKYTVDTTHVSAEAAAVFKMTLGEKGFVTGTAWVDNTGCVVKFVIDEASQYGNGTLEKKHLDVGMTAKK